jgi:hypothetical protein
MVPLLACGDRVASDADTDTPPVIDPDAPGASCPGALEATHLYGYTARAAVSAAVFVDLDDPTIECANRMGAPSVEGKYTSFAIDPADGALYYVARPGVLDGPTSILRAGFDALAWTEPTPGYTGGWGLAEGNDGADEVVTMLSGEICGGLLPPELIYHGPTEQLAVQCDGVAPGLALYDLEGALLVQWSAANLLARQFLADGRVVFESTDGVVRIAPADDIDAGESVSFHNDEAPRRQTVRMIGDDLLAAGVGSGGEVRRFRRDGGYFEIDAELGVLDVAFAEDEVDGPPFTVMLEDDGDVIVSGSVLMPFAEEDQDGDDVRAIVRRYSAIGTAVLFDAAVDPDEGLQDWQPGDPEVVLLREVFGLR